MKLTVTVNTDNDAFKGARKRFELLRIFREIIWKYLGGTTSGIILDVNGNDVGRFSIEK